MSLPRLTFDKDISKIKLNEGKDRAATFESIFFFEGLKHSDGPNERTKAILVDCEGKEMDAIIWHNRCRMPAGYDYEDKFVVKVKGYKNLYNGMPQITICEMEAIPPSDDEYKELVKVYTEYKQQLSPEEKEEYVNELKKLIDSVHNRYYRKLLSDLFDDKMLEQFKEWTAAWERHHAFPGGLLVHTVNVAKKCAAYAETSSTIDRDLLVTAALLHDIAKVKEYDGFPSKRRLYAGRLLYHPYMGAEMVAIQIDKYRENFGNIYLEVSDFPENLEIQLKHCILSHHGLPEYGAAVKPMILEANILHMMDDADAKEEYYKENVCGKFDANRPANQIKAYFDDFTKEFAYPTMHLSTYEERTHDFAFEAQPQDNPLVDQKESFGDDDDDFPYWEYGFTN